MKGKKRGLGLIVLVICIAVPLYKCSNRSKELREQVKSYTAMVTTTEAQKTVPEAAETTVTSAIPTETTTTTTETTTAPETTAAAKKTTPETTTTEQGPTPEEIRNEVQNGNYSLVTPEFKATMDAYEAFYDDYLAFMKKYTSGEGDMMAMLNDYTTMMAKMEEWSDRIDAIDETKLTPADDAYYLIVTLRIENKLIGAM